MNLLTTWPATLAASPSVPSSWRRGAALLVALIALGVPTRAEANARGAAFEGCSGCHNGGKTPTVSITPSVTTISPGQLLNLTISISSTNGNGAGFYIASSVGKFSPLDSGTHLAGSGVTQSATKQNSTAGAPITFTVGWTAPASPGGADFYVWGNSVNGDGRSGGDAEGMAFYSTAFGCAGTKFYHDYDGDGVGAESSGYTIACSVPQYYSPKSGDCNDNDPKIYAGAVDVCDSKDNNCDGQVDEGLPMTTFCADADGDGHGVTGKATELGCGVSKGFGLCDNDCNDNDPTIYPGASELCNNKDDNCNDRTDENARIICGLGWCAKYAEGCTSSCTPGLPRAEECNAFDDDCDGVADNGTDLALCGKLGLSCKAGYCVGSGSGGMSSVGSGGGSAGAPPVVPGAGASDSPSSGTAPPGCGFGFAGTRAPLTATALLLGFGALLRRKRRDRAQR